MLWESEHITHAVKKYFLNITYVYLENINKNYDSYLLPLVMTKIMLNRSIKPKSTRTTLEM